MEAGESQLLENLRENGERALAEVFAVHSRRLHQIIGFRLDSRLSQRVDEADIVQECFLEAWKRLPRYLQNPTVPVFVWLRGTAMDTLVHVHRRHMGAQMRSAGVEVSLRGRLSKASSSDLLSMCLRSDLTSPSNAAMRDEAASIVQLALAGMTDIDREVLLLRHFEQLTNDEVASIIGVKKAAASRRYMRALVHLGTKIREIADLDGSAS